MGDSYWDVHLHFVWATKGRALVVTPDIERDVYRVIQAQARKMSCVVLALNGMPDHIHLLVKYKSGEGFPQFMKQVKGVSSRAINDLLHPD